MNTLFALILLAAQPALTPPPTAADLAAAEATVQEVFGRDLAAARKPADKAALARRMLNTATDSDPAERFVLFTQARGLAIAARDSAAGVQAAEGLAGFAGPSDASEGHRLWNAARDLAGKLAAAEIYLRALPGLEGFRRTAVEGRLRELGWRSRFLSLAAAAELFRLDPPAWEREGDCLRGTLGDLNTAAGWAMASVEGAPATLEFGFAMRAPNAQCIRVEVDGTSWAYIRGTHHRNSTSGFWWGREGRWNMRDIPTPQAITPLGDWHRLAATIAAGKLTFQYDSEVVREVPLPPRTGPAAIRVGFGRQTAEVQVKDFQLHASN